jgi:hypothetical protein
LVAAVIPEIPVSNFLKDHLHETLIFPDPDIIVSHIGQTKGQLTPEARINKTRSHKDTLPAKRRATAEGPGNIRGEFNPFQAGYESAAAPR